MPIVGKGTKYEFEDTLEPVNYENWLKIVE